MSVETTPLIRFAGNSGRTGVSVEKISTTSIDGKRQGQIDDLGITSVINNGAGKESYGVAGYLPTEDQLFHSYSVYDQRVENDRGDADMLNRFKKSFEITDDALGRVERVQALQAETTYNGIMVTHTHIDHAGGLIFAKEDITKYAAPETETELSIQHRLYSANWRLGYLDSVEPFKHIRDKEPIITPGMTTYPLFVDHNNPRSSWFFTVFDDGSTFLNANDFKNGPLTQDAIRWLANKRIDMMQIDCSNIGRTVIPEGYPRSNLSLGQQLEKYRKHVSVISLRNSSSELINDAITTSMNMGKKIYISPQQLCYLYEFDKHRTEEYPVPLYNGCYVYKTPHKKDDYSLGEYPRFIRETLQKIPEKRKIPLGALRSQLREEVRDSSKEKSVIIATSTTDIEDITRLDIVPPGTVYFHASPDANRFEGIDKMSNRIQHLIRSSGMTFINHASLGHTSQDIMANTIAPLFRAHNISVGKVIPLHMQRKMDGEPTKRAEQSIIEIFEGIIGCEKVLFNPDPYTYYDLQGNPQSV